MNPIPPLLHQSRHAACAALLATLLAACSPGGEPVALVPLEIDRSTLCVLDGMLLADYPGPKAQIHYADRAEPDFFCDTVELMSVYLKPEQVRPIRALFVQDMGKTDWDHPQDNWIDARAAFYVHGSSRHGSMGPTLASFAREADAVAFAREHGGTVLAFAQITADKVVLDGGALHDQRM
ncbi:MAG: nitrous oxide reductase accessory protein NosL [Methyloversatilis sp.]|uniref:nitrous oxide reductase accessory protein NosL n=1 Tax=Methyloversatilis sp. TaxID=2569862 RepID=UPI002735E04A|nr:nitrous oxide reductase accessory protein NosL [Methyloversatilis sp.]MDP3872553.1 nitrous oxide reductase accessory protein NosL [Methyloversatilis sp.]